MIVLDTNVLSELMRSSPAVRSSGGCGTTELQSVHDDHHPGGDPIYSVALLPRGRRREALEGAVGAMFEEDFVERVLPFDAAAVHAFAQIAAERRHAGKAIAQLDAQIAAIARARDAGVATRNVKDFEGCGVELFDPWDARP